MKNIIIIFLFTISTKITLACQCPLTNLNEKEIAKYEIIFKGSIKSIKLNSTKSEAIFTVSELYKGLIAQDFKLFFDDEDPCKLQLRVGEEWIIYANYHQVDNAKLDYCSRSRYYIKNINEDFFSETTGISYDEEIRYLQSNLGLHKLLKDNPNKIENRNIIPNTPQLIITLLFSIIGVIGFYVIVNKLFKKYK